jgi:hypothetical protein
MTAHLAYLNATANRVAQEHAQHSLPVNWLSPYLAGEFEETRKGYVARAGAALNWDFQRTKPWVGSLSKRPLESLKIRPQGKINTPQNRHTDQVR